MTATTRRAQKEKARALQNMAAEMIKDYTRLGDEDIKPSLMSENGIDIKLSQAARRRFPFAVECKNQERLDFWRAIEQAELNAETEGLDPLLIFKKSRKGIHVVLRVEDFFKLLYKIKTVGCE